MGCWEDERTRAIAGDIRITSNNPIEECYNFAKENEFTVFAVQNDDECFAAVDAHETYNKYGVSTDCNNNGRGGDWAQNVYYVACEGKTFQSSVDSIIYI